VISDYKNVITDRFFGILFVLWSIEVLADCRSGAADENGTEKSQITCR